MVLLQHWMQDSRKFGHVLKPVLCGSSRTTSVVGIIIYERFHDKIASIERFDDEDYCRCRTATM